MIKGRCGGRDRTEKGCGRAYRWQGGGRRTLTAMRCPNCGRPLNRTSHQLNQGFRVIPTEVADLLVAGVYDDWGKV